MSWRNILGVTAIQEEDVKVGSSLVAASTPAFAGRNSYTQNTHNVQKPSEDRILARSADCERAMPEQTEGAAATSTEVESRLLEALAGACQGMPISPAAVRNRMSAEDVQDWQNGTISPAYLRDYAALLIQDQQIEQGERPADFTEPALCRGCGPIWLWRDGEVLSCPWCRNRLRGRPIPRPVLVQCGSCSGFQRKAHPHLGHCQHGEPEALGGLWDSTERPCRRYLPQSREPGSRHSTVPLDAAATGSFTN